MTPASIPVNRRRRHRESGWKQPMRGGEEDATMTATKCNGDGQFGGQLVAVIAAIAVVVVGRPL